MNKPSENGANGRDNQGRFAVGNRGGPGNPHAQRTSLLRNAMLSAVSADDVEKIIQAVVKAAKEGDIAAAREVLDRTIGKPSQTDIVARLESLEQAFYEKVGN